MDVVGVVGGLGVNLVGWEIGGDKRGSMGIVVDIDGMDGMVGWDFLGLLRDLVGRGLRIDKVDKF